MSNFNISDLLGTPEQHYFERTNESWKRLESDIARYQREDSITSYDMLTLISKYRRSHDDNLFDVKISSATAYMSQRLSKLIEDEPPTDFYKESVYAGVAFYESIDNSTISSVCRMIEDNIKNIKMRGSTFFVTLF